MYYTLLCPIFLNSSFLFEKKIIIQNPPYRLYNKKTSRGITPTFSLRLMSRSFIHCIKSIQYELVIPRSLSLLSNFHYALFNAEIVSYLDWCSIICDVDRFRCYERNQSKMLNDISITTYSMFCRLCKNFKLNSTLGLHKYLKINEEKLLLNYHLLLFMSSLYTTPRYIIFIPIRNIFVYFWQTELV